MPTCPLCEHSQETGGHCEVCGKELVAAGPSEVVAEPLPGLEQTLFSRSTTGEIEPVPGLEGTAQAAVPVFAEEPLAELERTAAASVEVVAEALPDIDRGRAVDDAPRISAPAGAATCRYCKNIQAEGMLCDRCGMRLPRAALKPDRAPKAAPVDGWARCRRCSEKVIPGTRCKSCGMEAPELEA